MKGHLLLVEDEPGLILTLQKRLEAEHYACYVAPTGQEGIDLARSLALDAVLLDVMLPDMEGFEVCRAIRQFNEQLPILMLTARSQTLDKVLGLKLGADDYLTKPFQMAELMARIEALLRRSAHRGAPSATTFRFGPVQVDTLRAEVTRAGDVVDLSAREYQLLSYFIKHRGEAVSRERLLRDVWGYDRFPNTRTVDVHVARLRQKLEPNPRAPQYINTIHNHGYRFDG
ncbi:MAG: response regulator transcription factor [Bacteroidota bacterium]